MDYESSRFPRSARRLKYGSIPTVIDNIRFSSKAEASRYHQLKLLLAAHQISDLELQPKYPIAINGVHVCTVILDFRYYDHARAKMVVEDVKGMDNPLSKLKRKLVAAAYGITVELT